MRVMPTLEGGLRIEIDSAIDWLILEHISSDALDEDGDRLPERLGALMDEKSEWDELVIPELRVIFAGQVGKVAEAIRSAQAEVEVGGEEASGAVSIGKEDADDWYGALNQARLGLEGRYHFGQMDEVSGLEDWSEDKRYAYVRNQCYGQLQSVLLEYVIE
jgi:hypothetical protein